MNSHDAAVVALTKNHLFGSAGPDDVELLADLCIRRTYSRGQYIWVQGDGADSFIVIADGMVKVVVASEDGAEILLTTAEAPDLLGELAGFDEGARSASVIAVKPTTVFVIKQAAFLALVQSRPDLLRILLRSMALLVRRLTGQVSDLVFLDLPGRIAKLLITLAERDGGVAAPTVTLDLAFTQTELANMVGGSRPAVNRALQSLAARRLITLDGRRIIIRDLVGLKRRAVL
jgi:CRP/FNR family transcriptional regulator, cyclic AMP receptor protein